MIDKSSGGTSPRVVLLHHEPDPIAAHIRARFPNLPLTTCDAYRDMKATVAKAEPDIVVAYKIKSQSQNTFPREVVLDAPSVRWIQATSAGVDHWMPWDPDRVTVTNASGIHGEIMAQHILWAILNHQLDFPLFARLQRKHEWDKHLRVSIKGKTLVVVGYGRIGQELGRVAKCFGMRVLGVVHPRDLGPLPFAEEVVDGASLHRVLAEGDFVSVILPLTAETRGLIDARALAAMKAGAYLINTGRGHVVDEAALLDALRRDHLSGAVLDVFAAEPLPPDSPFWSMENVVVTPHCSGDTVDWNFLAADVFCDNLGRWLHGEPLRNVVDPVLGF